MSSPEFTVLAAVVARAFDDINPNGNRAGLARGADACTDALRWVQGKFTVRTRDDAFMTFEHVCAVLGWPHSYLVEYAEHLAKGEGDEYLRQHPNIVFPANGHSGGAGDLADARIVGPEGHFRLSHILSSGT